MEGRCDSSGGLAGISEETRGARGEDCGRMEHEKSDGTGQGYRSSGEEHKPPHRRA